MRRAELCNILVKNINFSKNEIFIIGKGNKERIIPISPQLSQALKNYQENYRKTPLLHQRNISSLIPKAKITEKFVYLVVTRHLSMVSLKEKKAHIF